MEECEDTEVGRLFGGKSENRVENPRIRGNTYMRACEGQGGERGQMRVCDQPLI